MLIKRQLKRGIRANQPCNTFMGTPAFILVSLRCRARFIHPFEELSVRERGDEDTKAGVEKSVLSCCFRWYDTRYPVIFEGETHTHTPSVHTSTKTSKQRAVQSVCACTHTWVIRFCVCEQCEDLSLNPSGIHIVFDPCSLRGKRGLKTCEERRPLFDSRPQLPKRLIKSKVSVQRAGSEQQNAISNSSLETVLLWNSLHVKNS